MKQVEVTILGQGYILGCPEGGEALLQAAVKSVDQEMVTIRDGGKVKARERIAVLAALNLAYRLAEPADGTSTPLPQLNSGEIDAMVKRLDAVLGNDGHLI
jgi:cell division protein ZapA